MKEKVILNRMKAGDEEAFAWLYNHYWQRFIILLGSI